MYGYRYYVLQCVYGTLHMLQHECTLQKSNLQGNIYNIYFSMLCTTCMCTVYCTCHIHTSYINIHVLVCIIIYKALYIHMVPVHVSCTYMYAIFLVDMCTVPETRSLCMYLTSSLSAYFIVFLYIISYINTNLDRSTGWRRWHWFYVRNTPVFLNN